LISHARLARENADRICEVLLVRIVGAAERSKEAICDV
jgi:hypothetical protein